MRTKTSVKKCCHYWDINAQNLGTCQHCGATRQFPSVREQLVAAAKYQYSNKELFANRIDFGCGYGGENKDYQGEGCAYSYPVE